jgi:hypothetical protein
MAPYRFAGMSSSPSLAGFGDLTISSLGAVGVMVTEVVASDISAVPTRDAAICGGAYHRAKASLQKTHEYGLSPESE